jgi:hypothetical protein
VLRCGKQKLSARENQFNLTRVLCVARDCDFGGVLKLSASQMDSWNHEAQIARLPMFKLKACLHVIKPCCHFQIPKLEPYKLDLSASRLSSTVQASCRKVYSLFMISSHVKRDRFYGQFALVDNGVALFSLACF